MNVQIIGKSLYKVTIYRLGERAKERVVGEQGGFTVVSGLKQLVE